MVQLQRKGERKLRKNEFGFGFTKDSKALHISALQKMR